MTRVSVDVLKADYARGDSLATIARNWRTPERTIASRLRRAGVRLRQPGFHSAVFEALREIHSMKREAF